MMSTKDHRKTSIRRSLKYKTPYERPIHILSHTTNEFQETCSQRPPPISTSDKFIPSLELTPPPLGKTQETNLSSPLSLNDKFNGNDVILHVSNEKPVSISDILGIENLKISPQYKL